MERSIDYSPRGRSMSISPEYYKGHSPDYMIRSPCRSPHYKRHNGHRSPNYYGSKKSHHHDYSEEKTKTGGSDYDSDRDYRRESSWEQDRRSRSRSPGYSRIRHRGYRSKENDRERHRSRSKRSRSGSRWESRSEDRKTRDRDRSYRDDDRDSVDSERSPNGAIIGASGSEIIGYKSQPPNNTIMIRGLAQHISENDIRQDIIHCGLMPKDIRLIRKKDTGTSRGFAFVEFSTLGEAVRWMDMKQGVLMLQDQYRAIMQYSIPKDLGGPNSEKPPSHKASADWFCIKCGAQNFKRRDNCFKCHASRMESEEGGSGSDEICTYTTKTIMIRNLDALTTEDSVMTVLNSVIPELVKSISAVCIGRDPLTSTSRGICYIGTESTIDALAIHGALSNLANPLIIDGKTVILSYCKYNMGDSKKAYSQVDNATFPNAAVPSTYAMADVESLAEYAARRYAKTTSEYMHYIDYYRSYFTQQISAGNSITLHQENQMDAANAAAAVAQSAIQQMHANKTFYDTTHMAIPSGTDGKIYAVPDIATYTYDKTTGYQYDPSTGLYYDPNSNYYWNSVIQKYLYWDQEKLTYVLAPMSYSDGGTNHRHQNCTGQQQQVVAMTSFTVASTQESVEQETKKSKSEKQDKVKVAKKIAKDMERWAKTLNQKKESFSRNSVDMMSNSYGSASADVGFSVLEKKHPVPPGYYNSSISKQAESQQPQQQPQPQFEEATPIAVAATPLVAAYRGESDSSDDEESLVDETDHLDFGKLICNLCKRQLGSSEALTKHAQFSDLHRVNLENARKQTRNRRSDDSTHEKVVYRDRARERRMKYGDPDEPQPSKLKEKYLKSRELADVPPVATASISEPIGAENVGNKLLQKMGWTEGQGLGKSNQGRTTIIQAEQRTSTVGLGNKAAGYNILAGESYKDCVKKMMYARYQELKENDI